ncbi:hypothetical protein BOTBODRAFT_49442 [Botryobasidium botryosum FD-172 SS1]|uniref:Uncharacterized protein n=1 Tax=Botryobasidium botryosum (strain FD-172 SS1) TaxID=930990 RepID=A0A067M459_BOTB1|nr:hypothetical protein BOTBODRAFT_49442 [Botryobasidium botryosum FD-172 SS1]
MASRGCPKAREGAAWLARGDTVVIMATASSAAWQAVYVIVKIMPHGQQKLRDGAYKCRRLVSNSFYCPDSMGVGRRKKSGDDGLVDDRVLSKESKLTKSALGNGGGGGRVKMQERSDVKREYNERGWASEREDERPENGC